MEEKIYCTRCGEELSRDEAILYEDEWYCEECLDEFTYVCDRCGRRIDRRDAITDSSTTLCYDCYCEYYNRCDNCGRLIRSGYGYYDDDDEETLYCEECYHKSQKIIHSYSYKPYPIFHGDGNRYFGVELEVDDGGKDTDNAETILDIGNHDEDNIYIKTDGSIDDGFEIVTHPCTLEYHSKELPWNNIMDELIEMGYLSHKTSTCGLHCHINRTSLGETREIQDEVIARILYFVEHHWDEMLKFSRRTQSQIEQWASRYGRKNNPTEFIDNVKKSYDFSRYKCINLLNYNTIEFRLYRGTLRYNTFIATLQLTNEICNAAVELTDEEMTDLTWTAFTDRINKEDNKELFIYLSERNLYNETNNNENTNENQGGN